MKTADQLRRYWLDDPKLKDHLLEMIRYIQADALEAAAQVCVPLASDPDCSEQWIPEYRECAEAIRKLKPEGT